jgi:uncharacterized protein YndB with AHSA1/START domain
MIMTVDTLHLTRVPTTDVAMLIRRPPDEVFRAFVDPAVTTRFWFTASSGKVTPGAVLRWEWEMYGVHADVRIIDVEENRRIAFQWNDEDPTTVDVRFTPRGDGTYVQITETAPSGDGDALVAHAVGSTGGFTIVLCAMKALLEHDVVLSAVRDRYPEGLGH